MENTSIELYQKYLFKYGILSILYVLKHCEELENYEECKKIIDAIRDKESTLKITLFTHINENTINEVIKTYKKFNLTGVNAVENSKYYAEIIIEELKIYETNEQRSL